VQESENPVNMLSVNSVLVNIDIISGSVCGILYPVMSCHLTRKAILKADLNLIYRA